MNDDEPLIRHLYDRFNARDIDAVLSTLAEDVAWANGMENTHVHGPEAVREYWTHQWSVINPHVDPLHMTKAADGSTVVQVHLTVHNLEGKLVLDEMVGHVFQIVQAAGSSGSTSNRVPSFPPSTLPPDRDGSAISRSR